MILGIWNFFWECSWLFGKLKISVHIQGNILFFENSSWSIDCSLYLEFSNYLLLDWITIKQQNLDLAGTGRYFEMLFYKSTCVQQCHK